ncbi:MAG: ribonuclease H-like domain-containing protein [Candidatus Micrarchaeota archaeon]
MPNYYLDIETTGLDCKKDKIITIQYQRLDSRSGLPNGDLHILKEWESSEKEIIQKFSVDSGILSSNPFSFVSVGFNLKFEHNFLNARSKLHALNEIDILSKPFLDLHSCAVIMNNGAFKDSGLDKITNKPHSGSPIPKLYENKEYDKIIKYIEIETTEFLNFSSWLYKELPTCLANFKSYYNKTANK